MGGDIDGQVEQLEFSDGCVDGLVDILWLVYIIQCYRKSLIN
jgi:hypothetical protein